MLFKWFSRLLHAIVFLATLYIFTAIFAPILVEASPITNVFINEIHYDNDGGDFDEYVEIAGDADIDLTGWSLWLYNGSTGKTYNSFFFDRWTTIDTNQFGFHAIKTKGIQNGSPDGVVLFDGTDIIQFLSYEGSFTASNGVAIGLNSNDIGVTELTNTPLGFSLQLTGQGSSYTDFTWSSPQENTFGINKFGASNIGQQFIKPIRNSIPVNEPSSLLIFFIIIISLFISSHRSRNSFHPPFDKLRMNGRASGDKQKPLGMTGSRSQ
jgi:hypothetical protein